MNPIVDVRQNSGYSLLVKSKEKKNVLTLQINSKKQNPGK